MPEINWNLFKTKFNGKERSTFENLAYHLFCAEHNNNIGIFRFKNQTGIETEPIQTDDGIVGFQAKFYDTKIADNKDDIVDSIKKAKRENSNLNKIIIYLNQEFAESSTKEKKDPEYKTEIENEALKINLCVDWRVPSHFERQLLLPENQYLAEYFFGEGKSVIDFIDGLKNHAENIFLAIQTSIVFNETSIKIDRQKIINVLDKTLSNPNAVILSGEGGCGKTAVVKEFFEKHKDATPFYVFKAVEFNVKNIKSLFTSYGDYSLQDFTKAHEKEKQKIVVIDSAERISDLEYQEPFKEFLSELLRNSWTIIFTTRLSYLDDLRFQFLSVYRLHFDEINIVNLTGEEIKILSEQYAFELPVNDRMKKIICNLFYLDEYLRNYSSYNNSILYAQFKQTIWLRKIQNSAFTKDNSHILRERCFLNIAKIRSERGTFYVKPTDCTENILSLLLKDEIIGYDKNSGGYFITHDIYEEWGLNILIDRTYNSTQDYNSFLIEIGKSLIVRRAFRQWLSNKLLDNIEDIKPFINEAFENDSIEAFWKDEILTSILLSDYSDEFFNQFNTKILANDFTILKKIIFLLRISCKEVDDTLVKLLGSAEEINLKCVFTKPKGKGWNSAIHLIFENQDSIALALLPHILPLLSDWCRDNKIGNTTREAGLIALRLYTGIQTNNEYRYSSDFTKPLIKIIIQSANEIKTELAAMFDKVIAIKSINNRDVHYDLCEAIISSDSDNVSIIIALPEYVIKLAELFWLNSEKHNEYHSRTGVESYYGLNDNAHHDYFPASALQTPIYWLLHFAYKKTIDFIIDFTNSTVTKYVDSELGQDVQEIELTLGDGKIHKQYLSNNLWNMYRGSGSPVSPYLLQSIHMALEKYLLEIAKKQDSKIVESWLFYLIEKSNSASLTSVVTSIVLANPDKFFNIAKILFSSSALIFYDDLRARIGEDEAKSLYSIGRGLNYKNNIYEDERLKSCDDKHRRHSLESLIVNFQFFRNEHVSEEEANQKQKEVWEIIDRLYKELPEKSAETDDDKTKRLLLARIDRRKMDPKVETQGDNLILNLNPQIDEELKKHSEDAVKEGNEMMKYTSLKLWATYKFDKSKKYGDYQQYENDPQLVLQATKEIIEGFKNNEQANHFHLINQSIPAFTCSALIREYSSKLSDDDKNYCADIIVEYATLPLRQNYQYQIADGVEVSINALPFLIELFPDKKKEFLTILLLILFDPVPIGEYKRICDYSIESTINNLWRISFEDAKKILYGFLKFSSAYNSILIEVKDAAIKERVWGRSLQSDIINKLMEKYGDDMNSFMSLPLTIWDIDISKYKLHDLEIAFQLVPYDTNDADVTALVSRMLLVFAKELLHDDREREIDYSLRHKVLRKFSYFILLRDKKEIGKYIKPFVDNYIVSKEMASFFEEFIFAEDRVVQYDQFWTVWESFYEIIKENSSNTNYYLSSVIHNYLLAWNNWNKTAESWQSLKEREKIFYRRVVKDMGHLPSVLDSIAKLLNQIGSDFLSEGIFWISDMIEKNKESELEINTVYYIEKIVRKYIFLNRNKIRQDDKVKNRILVILNFLIERGSVNAYLLREDIL